MVMVGPWSEVPAPRIVIATACVVRLDNPHCQCKDQVRSDGRAVLWHLAPSMYSMMSRRGLGRTMESCWASAHWGDAGVYRPPPRSALQWSPRSGRGEEWGKVRCLDRNGEIYYNCHNIHINSTACAYLIYLIRVLCCINAHLHFRAVWNAWYIRYMCYNLYINMARWDWYDRYARYVISCTHEFQSSTRCTDIADMYCIIHISVQWRVGWRSNEICMSIYCTIFDINVITYVLGLL